MTIALQIFDVLWLCAVLWLLWNIWRVSVTRTQRMEQTLLEVVQKNTEITQKAADTARMLAEKLVEKQT